MSEKDVVPSEPAPDTEARDVPLSRSDQAIWRAVLAATVVVVMLVAARTSTDMSVVVLLAVGGTVWSLHALWSGQKE